MLEYKISPEFEMILIRMDADVTIDHVYDFICSIVKENSYDPTYRIIVNNKALEESDEVNKICQNITLAASAIGSFFARPGTKTPAFCYCRH